MRKATRSGTTEGFFENHHGQLHQVCRAVFCFSGIASFERLQKLPVLTLFMDMLWLPVTIVPCTASVGVGAGGAIGPGVGAAIWTGSAWWEQVPCRGSRLLNPQQWAGSGGSGVDGKGGSGSEAQGGYESFTKDGVLFEVGDDDRWHPRLLLSIASAQLLGLEQHEQFGFLVDWTPQGM